MFDIITVQTNVRNRCSILYLKVSAMRDIYEKKAENKVLRRARLRRRNERKKLMMRFAASLVIVMAVMTFTLSLRSYALAKDRSEPNYKYYTAYTVQPGDSLSAIASEYISDEYSSAHKYISEVVSINHLISASDIKAGQVIYIPYYSSELK